jgi:plastocyanin
MKLSLAGCVLTGLTGALAGCGSPQRRPQTAQHTSNGAVAVRSAEHDAREAAALAKQAVTARGRRIPLEPQNVEPNKGTPGVQDYSGGKIDVPIRAGAFTPPAIRLHVGQIVVFTNDDSRLHTVWADHAGQPHSGALPVGGRYEFEPLKPGRVRYHCAIHPRMHGVLIVEAR